MTPFNCSALPTVTFVNFRDGATGRTSFTLGESTWPILKVTLVLLLDVTTDAAKAGFLAVALDDNVTVEVFPSGFASDVVTGR